MCYTEQRIISKKKSTKKGRKVNYFGNEKWAIFIEKEIV